MRKPDSDNFGKTLKDKMDIIYANQAGKTLTLMAWFEIRPGHHRCIGVANAGEVSRVLDPGEMQWVSFTPYRNPKRKGDQKL